MELKSDTQNSQRPFQEDVKILGANEWPVGTILPVYWPHRVEMPEGWCICGGQVVLDAESPFYNLPVPNLLDERFPMGTTSQSYGKYGGTNTVAAVDDHAHSYSIQRNNPQPNPYGYQGRGNECYISTLSTSAAGGHDHGGENRPKWFGVAFMIKYKTV
jgi:hypothetical protein